MSELTFTRVGLGTLLPAAWTQARASAGMRGKGTGRLRTVLLTLAAAVTLAGHVVIMIRALLVGSAWQAVRGRIVLIVTKRDGVRRWVIDGLLIVGGAAFTWWLASTGTGVPALVALTLAWVGLVALGPWLRRRYPRCTWVVAGISARRPGAGALIAAARHVEALAGPGAVVGVYAATDRHVAVYRRMGLVSSSRDSRAMSVVVPDRQHHDTTAGPQWQARPERRTPTLEMPRLSGGPDRAHAMADDAARRFPNLAGSTLVLDCRPMLAGGASFAAALIHELFKTHRLAALEVHDAPDGFIDAMRASAQQLGMDDRVKFSAKRHPKA